MNTQPARALDDLRIIEWCDEKGAWAGKLLADMGAELIKIEPPGCGDATRQYGPFVDDSPDPERSLWFWNYNTGKKSVTLDVTSEQGQALFRKLVKSADIVIESQPPGHAASLGIDYDQVAAINPRLIWLSMTSFGRNVSRKDELATDLTLLAGGGIAWMNGYDDHTLPPVRGGGNQGYHTGCHYGVLSLLVALLHRDRTDEGQFIDVNFNAAVNVTTEAGTFQWLVAKQEVQRQTGRHAGLAQSNPSQFECADGRYVNLSFAARKPAMFRVVHDWLGELDLQQTFEATELLQAGMNRGPITIEELRSEPKVRDMLTAARQALVFIAQNINAYDFFRYGQDHGLVVSIIYSPEEMIDDEHFRFRGMAVPVEHPELGRTITYPGSPYKLTKTPWKITRRPPLIGEDNQDVYSALGLSADEISSLSNAGVI